MPKTDPLYLRPDAIIEPLFARWHAWIQLIAPATAALNVAHRHIPLMTSFVSSPMLHEAAAKKPEMMGGRFIDHGAGRVAEIESLLAWTRREQADLIALAGALRELHDLLQSEATGLALEPLYSRIPEALRGLVELEYDLYGRPSFRLLEALVYRSAFYRESFQSLAIQAGSGRDRPFILATPRLDDPAILHLALPFADPALDALSALRTTAGDTDELRERLGVEASHPVWNDLFTAQPPSRPEQVRGDDVRLRYFGHACLLIETAEVSILIDPVVSSAVPAPPARFSFADLPQRIDYVLISHHHQDHAQLETLLQLRHKIGTLVVGQCLPGALQDPSLKLMFRTLGFRRVVELAELETIDVPGGAIQALPFMGEHHDLAIRSRIGFRVELLGRSMAALVDSCNIEPAVYERVRDAVGPTDILFLGMECVGSPLSWSYGPLLPKRPDRAHDQSRLGRGSGSDEGRALVQALGARTLFIYALGQEPWLRSILGLAHGPDSPQIAEAERLIGWCREHGIDARRLYGKADLTYSNAGRKHHDFVA
jgi:L-ascorbate metabolism protein UlaG (beta-lactamase superfamily)